MSAMAFLEIESVKECTFPRVKFARSVHERVERYSAFFGAPNPADLVERALVQVMPRTRIVWAGEQGRCHSREGHTAVVC
jgi:hypothetical protein